VVGVDGLSLSYPQKFYGVPEAPLISLRRKKEGRRGGRRKKNREPS
jgi:hypothetical protein